MAAVTANWEYEALPKNHGLVTFDASGSHADAGIAKYEWGFGSGEMAEGVTAEHQYTEKGFHSVTLTVTDVNGLTDYRTRSVEVKTVGPNKGEA